MITFSSFVEKIEKTATFLMHFFVFGILLVIGSRLDFDIVNRIVDVVLYPFANRFAAYD